VGLVIKAKRKSDAFMEFASVCALQVGSMELSSSGLGELGGIRRHD